MIIMVIITIEESFGNLLNVHGHIKVDFRIYFLNDSEDLEDED